MRRTITLLLSLTLSIVAGAALGFSPPASASCDRVQFKCPQAGNVVSQLCMNFSCWGKCPDCYGSGCSSGGCCYHEYIACPDWGGELDKSVICGGACLRTHDWE